MRIPRVLIEQIITNITKSNQIQNNYSLCKCLKSNEQIFQKYIQTYTSIIVNK